MAEHVVLNGMRLRGDEMLRPAEARILLKIGERTLREWAAAGVIPSQRTESGHRRYLASDVIALRDKRRRAGKR